MKHTLIPRWVLVAAVLLAVGVLLTGVALAQPGSGTGDQLAGMKLSGGHYQLITTSSPVNTLASGGGYRLLPSIPAVDPAAGCCCKTNLPCVRK